jgi:hypothetical protein
MQIKLIDHPKELHCQLKEISYLKFKKHKKRKILNVNIQLRIIIIDEHTKSHVDKSERKLS